MAKKTMLEQARKAYNKSASTKYRVQANGKRTKKKKEKVKSHYGNIQKKTQNTEENRREARNQTKNVASKVGSNVVKKKTTESKPTTTGTNKQNGRRSGAITSVSSKSAERRTGAATARTTAKNVGNAVKTSTNLHKTPLKVTDVTQGTAKGTAAGTAYNKSKAADKALQKAGEKKTLTVSREQLTAEQKAAQERAARQTRFYTNSLVASGRMTQKQADDAVEKARKNAKKGVKEDHTLTYSNSAQSNETVQRVANASKFANTEVEDKKAAEKAMREARFYANSQVAAGKMTQKEADRLVKQAGKGHRTTQSANILDKLGGEGEAERQGTRQAGQLNDSKFASGVMQGLSYADNTRAVGKYNKQAAELVDTVKQSGAFNTGYMVGQAGQFMLGGTGKMTDALVKGVAKSGAARSALNIGLRKAGADALFESPINALDAVKMSTDANGNFDKNAFVKYMALNTGLSGGMGGAIGGVGSKLAKNDAKAYITLSAKANSGAGLTEQEKVRLVNLQKKMESIRNGNDVANTDIVNKADYDAEVSKKVFENGGTVDDAIKVVNGGGTHTEKIGYANSIKETANAEFERLRVAREQMLEQARNATPEEAKLLRQEASKLSGEITRLGEIANTAEKQLAIELKRNKKAVTELTQNVKAMSEATGINYRVVNDKDMKKLISEAGGDVSDNYFYKGFYYKNKNGETEILINSDSPQAHQTVIGHETGHLIKSSNEKEFNDLGNMLEEYAKKNDDFDAVYNQLKRSYPDATEAELREEVTCELLGRYVYGADDKFIKQLAGERPSVIQRIVDYLKKLVSGTSDKEMAKELQSIIKKTESLVKGIDNTTEAKVPKKSADNVGYHAGDLGKAESMGNQTGGRGTGHFGTGTYFVGNKVKIDGYNARDGKPAPVETVNFDKYNLYKPHNTEDAYALHDFLRDVNDYFELVDSPKTERNFVRNIKRRTDDLDYKLWDAQDELESLNKSVKSMDDDSLLAAEVAEQRVYKLREELYELGKDALGESRVGKLIGKEDPKQLSEKSANEILWDLQHPEEGGWYNNWERPLNKVSSFYDGLDLWAIRLNTSKDKLLDAMREAKRQSDSLPLGSDKRYTADSASTILMKRLGYEGVDVRHTDLDNTTYGSVIYDLKDEDLARKQEIGTARFSKQQVDKTSRLFAPVGKDGMRSKAWEVVANDLKGEKFGAKDLPKMLEGKGVKAEELKWTGLDAFLDGKKSVSKQELMDFFASNTGELHTIKRGNPRTMYDVNRELAKKLAGNRELYDEIYEKTVKFERETDETFERLGVEPYKETPEERALLELADDPWEAFSNADYSDTEIEKLTGVKMETFKGKETRYGNYMLDGAENYREYEYIMEGNEFQSAHWGEEGVVIHSRIGDFTARTEENSWGRSFENYISENGDNYAESANKELNDNGGFVKDIEFDGIEIKTVGYKTQDGKVGFQLYANDVNALHEKDLRIADPVVVKCEINEFTDSYLDALGKLKQDISVKMSERPSGSTDSRTLYVDEIQSDLHNKGHKNGYKGDDNLDELKAQSEDLYEKYSAAKEKLYAEQEKSYGLIEYTDDFEKLVREQKKITEEIRRLKEADRINGVDIYAENYSTPKIQELRNQLNSLEDKKTAIRDAAKEKHGDLFARIESLKEESDSLWNKNKEIQQKIYNAENAVPDAPYKKNYTDYAMKRALREAVENDYEYLAWSTGKIHDERWQGALDYSVEYDTIIPKFMKKYVKQWNGQVEKIRLAENGEEVWGVKITPEMRESVSSQGQYRFSKEEKKTESKTPETTETQKIQDNNNASAEVKQALVDIDKAGVYKDDAEKVSKRFNDLESKIKKEVAHLENAKKSDKYATEAERAERVAEIEDELKTLRNQQAKAAGKIEQMGKMKAVDDSIDPQDQFHQLRGETSRTNKELQNADNLKNEDNWIKDKWNSVRRLWEDSLIEVENVAKRSDDKKLREEILTAANRVRNSQNVANFWITKGRSTFDNKVSGKSLDEIFPKELLEDEAKYKDFQEYLIMKHVPARHAKGTDIYPEVSPELADKIVKKLEGKYGKELTDWADDVYRYLKDLQQYRVDSGMLSKKAADQFAKDYPFYVPTNRVNEDEAIDFFTGGLSNQIRTAKGGENDVLDMYSQLYTATNKTIHAAEENEMLNLYFRAKGVTPEQIKGAELPDLEHAVIEANVNKKTGSATVSFFVDGKPVKFPCSHQLALGLRELDGLEFERLMNAAKVSTLYGKPFKALITDWNLVFGVRNGMRDMQQAVVNSKDTRYFGSSFGAASHAVAHEDSPYRKLYASMGGERAQLVSYDAVAKNLGIEKQGKIDALHEKAQDWVDAEIKGVHTNPIHYIEGINGAIEMMPRMCEFIGTLRKEANSVLKKQGSSLKKLRKEIIDEVNALEKEGKIGQSEIPAEVENRLANRIIEMVDKDTIDSAMRNANDITLNFGRSGVLGKALNMGFVPYLNPSIQGLSKLVRLFTEAGGEGGWKALASLGMKLGTFTIAPAVFNELALRNNEEYQNLNTRDKDNNFFIALGDGKFIKIPKPRENAVLAEPVEYGLRYFLDKSEYAFFDWDKLKMEDVPLWEKIPLTDEGKQSLRTAIDNIGVINPMTSNMVSPLWQTFHNKTWYGGSIESAYETSINEDTGKANVPVNERYDTGTSGVAIWLGQSKVAKELNLSPKKIDNILDSYTGMIYDLGISQTTEEAKTRGNYLLRTAASQFLKDSVFSNKLSTKAWEKIDGMTKKEQDEYKAKYMYDAYKYDDAMDAITADKNMTVKEKMDAKRALQKQRNKLYRAAINGEPNETNPLKDISKYLGANKTLNKFLPKSGDEKYDNWTDYYKNYKKTKGYKGLTPAQKEKEAQKFLDVYTLGVKGQSKVSGDFHDSPSWGMTGVAAAQRYKQGKLSQKDAKTIMESCGVYESQTASYFKYADHGGNVSRYAVTKKNNNKAEDLAESMGVATSGDGSIWKNKYSKEKGIKGGVLSMSLATGKADFKDRAYYISNSGDSNMLIKMNAARGYSERYGHTTKQLIKLGKKADKDGNTYLSNEEIESACQTIKKGKATSEEKAMAWVLLGGNPNKNPFGAIGNYSHDGDTGITMDGEEKSGGRGGHGWGRRRRRGGGGGGSSKGTMPKTASGAIKGTVSDPFSGISRIGGRSGGSASTNTRKSNLNDAYRKRVKKLRQNLS